MTSSPPRQQSRRIAPLAALPLAGLAAAFCATLGHLHAVSAAGTDPSCGPAIVWTGNEALVVNTPLVPYNVSRVVLTADRSAEIVIPSGSFDVVIDTFDRYDVRATAPAQLFEQAYISVGGVDTGYSADLADGVAEAYATSSLGRITTAGGPLYVRHRALRDPAARTTAESHFVSRIVLSPVCDDLSEPTTSTSDPMPGTSLAAPTSSTSPSSTSPSSTSSSSTSVPDPTTPVSSVPVSGTAPPSDTPEASTSVSLPSTAPTSNPRGPAPSELPDTGGGAGALRVGLLFALVGAAMVAVRRGRPAHV